MSDDKSLPAVGDIPAGFTHARGAEYERRLVDIAMRDGVRLNTIIVAPCGVEKAPIILERTPYGAQDIYFKSASLRAADALHPIHAELIAAGYILAFQDVRGKHDLGGIYVMNQPLRGPLNGGDTDHATDAADTIDWLVANVSECNGAVGMLGLSYMGFTALMALFDAPPSLKACVSINPMVDCWIGDDWFRNGAFRQLPAAHYVNRQTTRKGEGLAWPSPAHDEYEAWLEAGSAQAMAKRLGLDDLPVWRRRRSSFL